MKGGSFAELFPRGMISRLLPALMAIIPLGTGALAGDILRGGATADPARRNTTARANSGAEAAAIAKRNADDRLARTTQVIQSLRNVSPPNSSSNIPNGLIIGGLQVANPSGWVGANLPTQRGNVVNIVQTEAQAQLFWESFNVGGLTTLNFDQSAGGTDIGKWIAFNQVVGNTPSRIAGSIRAGGQAYVINQNGIRIESGARVEARSFTASTLPINSNLVSAGIVNLTAGSAEFLFSTTPQNEFTPPPPPASGQYGNVTVDVGALIQTSTSAEGSGGRILLVGANVSNRGQLSAPSGQVILAAGLQVGLAVHSQSFPQIPGRITDARTGNDDPSLRGLDAYVGNVGNYAGSVLNSGLVSIPRGSLMMVGSQVSQNGGIDGLTTVNLNSRIDLLANYGAVPASNFTAEANSIPFLNTQTGRVFLGAGSVTRILPDYASPETSVSEFNRLSINSQINIQGRDIFLGANATILAPGADIAIAAGNWRAVPSNGVRTAPDFLFSGGQIYLDRGSLIDVSGSVGVFVPLSNSILEVQLRGNELSVSPLQRTGDLRGITLTIDARRTGTYYGRNWVGTPLGDASGFQDILQKTAAQLTANAGSALLRAGSGILAQPGSIIDVSGGYFVNEGGEVQTTRLLYQGRHIIDIADATPDRTYDAIYDGTTAEVSQKWGISNTFRNPLAPLGTYTQRQYIQGADGGSLTITAPALALDGELSGDVVIGPRQLRASNISSELPAYSSLNLSFTSQIEVIPLNSNVAAVFTQSPTPPSILLGGLSRGSGGNPFVEGGNPVPSDRQALFTLGADFFESTGFGSLRIDNSEGDFEVVNGSEITLPSDGSLIVQARNVVIGGSLEARGGVLDFTAYNLPRYQTAIDVALGIFPDIPSINPRNGTISLTSNTRLNVSGLIVDDRYTSPRLSNPLPAIGYGGDISLVAYNVNAPRGAVLDASGGLVVSTRGDEYVYGDGGSITVEAGQDPEYGSVLGGKLTLEGQLLGYSGGTGAILSIKAPLIQVGGSPLHSSTFHVTPEFFNQGGFSRFNLTGIGGTGGPQSSDPDAPTPYLPAVYIADGTVIAPRVEGLAYAPFPGRGQQAGLRRVIRPLGERPPVSLGFYAEDTRNDFEIQELIPFGDPGDVLLARGDIRFGAGTRVIVEPGGEIEINGSTIEVLGSLIAPGGLINIAGANSFPLSASDPVPFLRPTVFIGPQAVISTKGVAVYQSDPFGRRVGTLYDGGTISVSGNIVAAAGALLDVSGTTAQFDVHPSRLAIGQETRVPLNSGINSLPYFLRTVVVQAESNGGTLIFQGGEMLFSDATLLGSAGGPTALGGTLSISSGRGYTTEPNQLGSDINLVVTQGALTIPGATPSGVGLPVRDGSGVIVAPLGYFAANRFLSGGFDSLELGVDQGSSEFARGGNVEFRGPVSIAARGSLRVATGGVIRADATVNLTAQYIAIGQAFQAPFNPTEEQTNPYIPFEQSLFGVQSPEAVAPETGSGVLNLSAQLIDVGTLVLKGIGSATFAAPGGDIRGNGTLNIMGDLTLTAAQIYPTTLSDFGIFAYDPPGSTGSITIRRSGSAQAPLSAGGSLRLLATNIYQGGVLLAPFGSISLGYDGQDLDLSTPEMDLPQNRAVRNAIPTPLATSVVLQSGSITSVAGIDFGSNTPLLIPYGFSFDGSSIIDPRGVDVTASGLPTKNIFITGDTVTTEAGSVIDIRGGGDLFAYRWLGGITGPVDFLGETTTNWSPTFTYATGDLVSFGGRTFSARRTIRPTDFPISQSPTPDISRFWTLVPKSFAVVPGYTSRFAPYAPFNTGPIASQQLSRNPGYVSSNLNVGDQIYLDAGSGLGSGTFTLLPSRYALLPGAYLITPQASDRNQGLNVSTSNSYFVGSGPLGTYAVEEGAIFTTGYRLNAFNQPTRQSGLRGLYEILSPEVLSGRADYEVYDLSAFLTDAAVRLNLDSAQLLPRDSGYLLFHGNTGLSLSGGVLSGAATGGRSSRIDISSFEDISIVGDGVTGSGSVILNAGTLSGFHAGSLVIGGVRYTTPEGEFVAVRSQNISVDNASTPLTGSDIALVATRTLVLAPGSQILSNQNAAGAGGTYQIIGDGAAVRVAGDSDAGILRSGVTSNVNPLLQIGDSAVLQGTSVVLDSSYGFDLSPTVDLEVEFLTFGAGQIALLLDGPTPLIGQLITPQLALSGDILQQIQEISGLSLISYQSTIDLYGPGVFGTPALENLTLQTGELRGFNQGADLIVFNAGRTVLSNPRDIAAPPPSAAPTSGSLIFNSPIFEVGAGATRISKFGEVVVNAEGGILFSGEGRLTVERDFVANSPVLTTSQSAEHSLAAGGTVTLNKVGSSTLTPSLGGILSITGSAVTANSDILLPSGRLSILATGPAGNISVGGILDVSGTAVSFYDTIRYTDGGEIVLNSMQGGITLFETSEVLVSAHPGGGDAGTIEIMASQGAFTALGSFDGQAGSEALGGSFLLDAGSIASFDLLRDLLNSGGFSERRQVRVRSGDLIVAGTHTSRHFELSADAGSIAVTGVIDASGVTGGRISLIAKNNLTLQNGSLLTVAAEEFSNAGKGGEVYLEGGASTLGFAGPGLVDIQAGSKIDLSVAAYQQGATSMANGDFTDPTSSAFRGQFRGTLHIRAPQVGGNDVAVSKILGTITEASSILVEGYRIYDRTAQGGVMNIALRNQINTDGNAYITAFEAANNNRLLGGTVNAALDPILVVAPGVEIINTNGDLILGTSNTNGSASVEARTTADWDLSNFRYGSKRAPGVLTLRAARDVYINNTLSDGFTPVGSAAASGHSTQWLATLQTIDLNGSGALFRPINLQSWSFNITAGADLASASSGGVSSSTASGSLFVGEFFNNPVPNSSTSGAAAATGDSGTTANSIRISTTTTDTGTRFEVIRTGTGFIDVNAAKDVQLRNQFATIYTAGVRIPQPQNLFGINDFRIPETPSFGAAQVNQGALGTVQQIYGPTATGGTAGLEGVTGPRRIAQFAMAGGQISIQAGEDVGRYQRINDQIVLDSSRQLPNNWLYRRGYVDPETGLFGAINPTDNSQINDVAASTAWWIDYSNFFQGIGTLGGGDINLRAGGNIENVDVVAPTNARMSGRNASVNIAPNADLLLELGGGDISVVAGNNIDGGLYYVERGNGILKAGGEIKTNEARSPSFGYLQSPSSPSFTDPLLFLPTTLFAGKASFDVSAFGDVLLGPVANTFLLPQGLNNRFWHKTYFSTYSADSSVSVSSLQGDITHRMSVVTPTGDTVNPLWYWLQQQNRYAFTGSSSPPQSAIQTSSFYQPWLRLAETGVAEFDLVTSIMPATLKSTAFSGNINTVGTMNLTPSPNGQLELLASGAVNSINPAGILASGQVAYVTGLINVSDAAPSSLFGITSPSAAFATNRTTAALINTGFGFLSTFSNAFGESGSFIGFEAGINRQRPRHDPNILHLNDTEPVKIYAGTGDISGLTLFTPKATQIFAGRDITDISFYLQNINEESVSIVSAGRDLIPFQENSILRNEAQSGANILLAEARFRTDGTTTTALQGDIQINGPGALEVLAGRNIDLGSSEPFGDGTGAGITSIGRRRNPFLPAEGARLVVLAGVGGINGGAAAGLRDSVLDFDSFIADYIEGGVVVPGLSQDIQDRLDDFEELTAEQQAIVSLDLFYAILRQAATEQAETGSYQTGFDAIRTLFPTSASATAVTPSRYGYSPWDSLGKEFSGDIQTRTRNIRTLSGGPITIAAPGGGLTMAANLPTPSDIPPGIVTDAGGSIDIFLQGDLDIGATRVFTLRGGDLTIWSSEGDIAAGTAAKTVVSAPPTRVSIDATSGEVLADLGGLATGGGIGVLASVAGIEPGSVFLIAPGGAIDAGDAGIRATGDITLAATEVLNADNVSAGGTSTGVPSAPTVAAPNIGGLSSASSSTGATTAAANSLANQAQPTPTPEEETPSEIEVEVLGYGGGEG